VLHGGGALGRHHRAVEVVDVVFDEEVVVADVGVDRFVGEAACCGVGGGVVGCAVVDCG